MQPLTLPCLLCPQGSVCRTSSKMSREGGRGKLCQIRITHTNSCKHRLEWGIASRDRHWGYYNFLLLLPVRFHLGFIYLITAGTGLDSCCFRHCACLYELLFSSIIWAASAGCVLGSGGRQELQCSHRRDRPARTIELFQHSINVMAITGCRNSLIEG